jgi:hypothetical protein
MYSRVAQLSSRLNWETGVMALIMLRSLLPVEKRMSKSCNEKLLFFVLERKKEEKGGCA